MSSNNFQVHYNAILDAVSRFMGCKSQEAAQPICAELEQLYGESLLIYGNQLKDPGFAGIVGTCAHMLAYYFMEYDFDLNEADKYSNASRSLLKTYLDAEGDTLSDSLKDTFKGTYYTVCVFAAYCAYFNGEYREAIQLIMDIPAGYLSFAIGGCAFTDLAEEEKNPEYARIALKMFDDMDARITEPASKAHVEHIYRNAYGLYAVLLIVAPDLFPDAGFVREIHKALHVLRRGVSLLHTKQYIDELCKMIDKYSSML